MANTKEANGTVRRHEQSARFLEPNIVPYVSKNKLMFPVNSDQPVISSRWSSVC